MAIRPGDIVKFKTDPLKYGALRVVQVNSDFATCLYYHFGDNGKHQELIQLKVSLPMKYLVVLIKKPGK